jgi:hypothetical protein
MRRIPVATDARDVILGETYTDIVTGIKGVAVIVYIHLTGCDQVCLSYVTRGTQHYLTVDATRLAEISPAANPTAGATDAPAPSRGPSGIR